MDEITCVTGALVVYRQKPAKVNSISDGKIELTLPDGANKSVRLKDVIVLHSGPVSRLPTDSLPPEDLMEIVAMLEDETVSLADLAGLIYDDFSPESAWSVWTLLDEGIYFSGSMVDGIKARSEAEIATTLEVTAAKENSRIEREELIARIRSGNLLPEDLQHLRDVENFALGKTATSGIMRELNMEQTPEKAHRLLLKLKVWDCWTNPYPSRAGIVMENPDLPTPELPEEERVDLSAMVALAIDDAGNQDPDDAISYVDGLLWVHVADVAALVVPGSDIDQEAEARGANLYLPEQTVHMLPPAVTHQLGLGLQETSPALSFAISFDEDGAPTLEKTVISRVKCTRYSYEEAETKLNEEPLCSLVPLLDKFREFREKNGALRIELPEVSVKVVDGDVVIKPYPTLQSREMVAEAMMAAGAAVGKFALEKEIPVPFAVQPEPDIAGKPETLAGMFSARRGCSVTSVQTVPGRHSGLGLEPYVRITSPLRRYDDLLAHQQVRSYLAGELLQSASEIDGKIAKAQNASRELRRLERVVNEFWKLVYLELHPDWQGKAIVVERMENRLTVILPDLAYEYKIRSSGLELNDEWTVTVNAVDLAGQSAHFIAVVD